MKHFCLGLTALLVIGFMALGTAHAQSGVSTILKPYQWQNRLIIIFTDSEENSHYKEQLASLELYPFELEDRQLELLTIFDNTGYTLSFNQTENTELSKKETQTLDQTTAQDLRKHYNISNSFTILLVGKDGGVKRRSNEVLDAWEFFDQIDTMPMRQREMSR